MKKLLLAAAWIFLARPQSIAQVSPPFQLLNFTPCSSGFFWSQSGQSQLPPDGSAYVEATHEDAAAVLMAFRRADIDPQTEEVPAYESLRLQWNQEIHEEGVVPLSIAEMKYHYLTEASISNGWVFATPEGIAQQPGQDDIFAAGNSLSLLVDAEHYARGPMRFRLRPQDYFHNQGGPPASIRMDFDDGQGWREITPGETIAADYSGQSGDKLVRLEVVRNGTVIRSGYKLTVVECESQYDHPDPNVPWMTTGNPLCPWEISVETEGVTVRGNAFYLPSGVFDKPFIFVEGIDFGYHQTESGNGTFGWCEFTSGLDDPQYGYSMLRRMPELLNAVRQNGYDIILLDFRDGATWIQHNGDLLIHLIQMVNEAKTGESQLVLAGASMGGQVTRYALAKMEQMGQDHCTRLWISLDSPHTGAYIPIALQQALKGLAPQFPQAQDFLVNFLQRPAARQLLNVQYAYFPDTEQIFSPPLRNEWYQMLDELGYPKNCRKVAIANGNLRGSPIGYSPDEPLVDYSCEAHALLQGPELRFFLATSAGDPSFSDAWGNHSTTASDVSCQVVYTVSENPSLLGDLLNLLGMELSKTIRTYSIPDDIPNYDFAPGGHRRSMIDFVRSINRNLGPGESCNRITEYAEKHCFIPTASALGLHFDDPYTDVREWIGEHPEALPFDAYFGPEYGNEAHSEITEANLAFVLSEILGGEWPGGASLLPPVIQSGGSPSGIFNYGRQGFHTLPSITVTQGGRLSINRSGPTHFSNQGSVPAMEGLFRVSTLNGCDASHVIVSNISLLEVGDGLGNHRGELRIGRNAVVDLRAGGAMFVNPGSTVVVEDGGTLIVRDGAMVRQIGGTIRVEAGGRILYRGGIWHLMHDEAGLVLDGGMLEIAADRTLSFLHDGESGYLRVTGAGEQELFLHEGSTLLLRGTGPEDVMLTVDPWANLWNGNFGLGTLQLEDCAVELHDNGQIWTDLEVEARNVVFLDHSPHAGSASLQVWYNRFTGENCRFDNVRLIGHDSRLRASHSTFHGNPGGVEARGGSYVVSNCEFDHCSLASFSLSHVSTSSQCTFHGAYGLVGEAAIYDESLVRLNVTEAQITGPIYGIYKIGGTLQLACSEIQQCTVAVTAGKGCHVRMSADQYAGYNRFSGNGLNLMLDEAGSLNLNNGYNELGGYWYKNIYGTLAGMACPDDCTSPVLQAARNTWSAENPGQAPDPASIELRSTSYSMVCSSPPVYFNCPIDLQDPFPGASAECGAHKPSVQIIRPVRSAEQSFAGAHGREDAPSGENRPGNLRSGEEDEGNPLVYTETFDGVHLDEALIAAASLLAEYDSAGDDREGIRFLHEILLSDLDRHHPEVQWKMIWGREHMKGAIERLASLEELANDAPGGFDASVMQYVDVLNLMTDSTHTPSTYRTQFYLELDKAQLFRTLGRSDVAQTIFSGLGQCRLDSLEQSILQHWTQVCALEQLAAQAYREQSQSPDAIDSIVPGGTEGEPERHISDIYTFGLWIAGPDHLEFAPCGATPKVTREQEDDLLLYPNPARDRLRIRSGLEAGPATLRLLDTAGRLAWQTQLVLDIRGEGETALPGGLSPGVYLAEVSRGDTARRKTIFVE